MCIGPHGGVLSADQSTRNTVFYECIGQYVKTDVVQAGFIVIYSLIIIFIFSSDFKKLKHFGDPYAHCGNMCLTDQPAPDVC